MAGWQTSGAATPRSVCCAFNASVCFSSPWVQQIRNPHNYKADFNAELDLYQNTEELLRILDEWRPKPRGLPSQVVALESIYIELYEYGFVSEADVVLVQNWLRDVIRLMPRSVLEPSAPPQAREPFKRFHFTTADLHDGTNIDQPSILAEEGHQAMRAGKKTNNVHDRVRFVKPQKDLVFSVFLFLLIKRD